MTPETEHDTTIDEIHRTRERLAAKFGGDIRAILDDARQRQAASGRATWQCHAINGTPRKTGASPKAAANVTAE